jgi:carboxymethylenebutenolidase
LSAYTNKGETSVSEFSKDLPGSITRRDVLREGIAIAALCILGCDPLEAEGAMPSSIKKALDDPEVEHGYVDFEGGHNRIGAYMSRPRATGKYPAVLVVTGSSIEEYIQNTTAMLAQAGFVGFAPNIFWLQKPQMSAEEKRRVFADKVNDTNIFADLFASLKFLKSQSFVKRGKAGIMGFCFGGRCALMFAANCRDIGAIVPFYGNLKTPAFAKREKDPVDVVSDISAPVQGHYSNADSEIPLTQLAQFEHDLKAHKTQAEFFTYNAPHGFFAYTRESYREQAAALAWERTVNFLHKSL